MITVEELYALYKRCSGITTDSRNIKDGSMFFALKGEKFDGNDFALDALKAGARYAIVDRFLLEGTSWRGRKCIVVENSLNMLQEMAAYHRRQLDIPVIGITGTNGKTTTKELIAAVLSKKYDVVATQENFNNHIGVPLTLFRIDDRTDMAVVEMGASAPGEIAQLTRIVQPTCGLITTVGKAHIEGFGSFEGVKKAKGELYDILRQRGAWYSIMRTTSISVKWYHTVRACVPGDMASGNKAWKSFPLLPNLRSFSFLWSTTENLSGSGRTWSAPTTPTT